MYVVVRSRSSFAERERWGEREHSRMRLECRDTEKERERMASARE